MESDYADWNFKLNFIILFMNTMAETMKMGTINVSLLNHLGKGLEFGNINWCKYIVNCAKSSKVGWNEENEKNFYAGPITFLTVCTQL